MAKGHNTVKVKDHGAKKLLKTFAELKVPATLFVGVMGKEADEKHDIPSHEHTLVDHKDGIATLKKTPNQKGGEGALTVGEVAAKHELGLGVPKRSWLVSWFDLSKDKIDSDLKKIGKGMVKGKITPTEGLSLLGVRYEGQIKRRIAHNEIMPPTSEIVNEIKGSSVTLKDTGQLQSAITHIVKSGGKGHGEEHK